MLYQRWLAPVIVSFLVIGVQAQLRGGMPGAGGTGSVHVRVVLSNSRSAGPYLLVLLLDGTTDQVVGTTYTNDLGSADFSTVPLGNYHVKVSGDGIETTNSDTFEVDARKVTQEQYVTVRQLADSGPKPVSSHSTMISVADLNVPQKARKELDKANVAMAEKNWKASLQHLNQAIAIAPQYATAYNNLGVLYGKMNDLPHEEEALKKAISLDDHFATPFVNYGKMCLQQKNFPQAEILLQKAISAEPNNPETLMLLADAQYMNRHFAAAIVSAQQSHSAGRDHPSFVHYIAARAYQQEGQQSEALAEFQRFLQEEPKGPRADQVRLDISKIEASTQRAAQ